jgi:hypothetical protein
MPPAIPLFTLDSPGLKGTCVQSTRAGLFFAQQNLDFKRTSCATSEFGRIVYGPPRSTREEAEHDLETLKEAGLGGASMLRRLIAKVGALGGTKSFPSPDVQSVLIGSPSIELYLPGCQGLVVKGTRRPNVSVTVNPDAPHLLFSRVIDTVVDVLSCAVDSQLGIAPPSSELVELVKYSMARDKENNQLTDAVVESFVVPLIEIMKLSHPWSGLQPPRPGTDDDDVIKGLIHQLLDKSRRADQFGEKKQVKRLRKQVRDRKKAVHTVFVSNLPVNVSEERLFNLFNHGIEELKNPVYRVRLPCDDKSREPKSYAFVTFRSRRATNAVLAKKDWIMDDKKLYVAPRTDGEGSPSLKRQKLEEPATPEIPKNIIGALRQVVDKNPGCNISQIPDLLKKTSPDVKVDAHGLGFKNLTHLIQAIPEIRLKQATQGTSFRPVFYAFPQND